MAKSGRQARTIIHKLRTKYKLVLMHDKTFEIQTSLRLSMLNVIILISTLFVVIGFIIYSVIAFTPLKNLVVGYSEQSANQEVLRNNYLTDSIMTKLKDYDLYLANLQKRLNGDIDTVRPPDTLSKKDYSSINLDQVSETDKRLRSEVTQADIFNLSLAGNSKTSQENLSALYFFPPVTGTVSTAFDPRDGNYGVDIILKEDTPVKACLDGVVIDDYWDPQSGNVIVIQHDHGLISFYKDNARLLKRTGEIVKAGDVVAIAGNTGTKDTGPHLHFELWHEKTPVNPQDFIIFN